MSRYLLWAAMPIFAYAFTLMARPALADQTDDLKAQVQVLNAQIQALQNRQAADNPPQPESAALAGATPAPSNKVVGGDFPGSFKLPGTDTSVAIHGFVDLQAFYDPDQYLGGKFQVGLAVPNGPAQRQTQGTYHFHDKLTRFGFETRTPTKYGELKTVLIQDLYGYFAGNIPGQCANNLGVCDGLTGAGSIQNFNFGPRNLYAYGVLGRVLVGHYLSNFIDEEDQEEVLDTSGPAGVPAQQLPQIRYTLPLGKGFLSLSAETPATEYAFAIPATATTPATASVENPSVYNPRPDFTAKYNIDAPWGHAMVSGTLRRLAYDDGNDHRSVGDGTGMMVGATYAFHDGVSSAGGLTWFGNGIQKYTPDDFVPVSSVQINHIGTAEQQLFTANEHGESAFLAHTFSSVVRANVGVGLNHNYWADFIPADISQPTQTKTVHANIIWSPVPQTDFGFEFMHGVKSYRDSLNLPTTGISRLQTEFKFKF